MSKINANTRAIAPFVQKISNAKRQEYKAKEDHKRAVEAFKNECARLAKTDVASLEFSSVCCMSNTVMHHVYHIKVQSRFGSPSNKCIFCGCDNFDCF